jgi:chromate reductase, NAD(P)H dehydrogenase (quinone)
MKVLALCGSLRTHSLCAALLRATQRLAPADVSVEIFSSLGTLPLFNPDLESTAPIAVQNLWVAVTQADVILIASPEYAHGVTAVIKNALDWLVGAHLDEDGMVKSPELSASIRSALAAMLDHVDRNAQRGVELV